MAESGEEAESRGAWRVDGEDILLSVFAKPRASRSRVMNLRDAELEVALAAPPVEGAANDELRKFFARLYRLPKSRVSLERGESSRHKLLRFHGLELLRFLKMLPRSMW